MPIVKCEVISHDSRTCESEDANTHNEYYTLRVKMGVPFRPNGFAIYLIAMMLFIPYIFDDFYQISRGYFPSSMRPSPFVNRTEHKSCSDKMHFLFNWTLGSIFKIAFYPLGYILDLWLFITFKWCPPVGINFCTPPNFDFKDGEATFKGFDNHYLQNPIKKNYPGEEMEIDFSPVLFWCLFKPPKYFRK